MVERAIQTVKGCIIKCKKMKVNPNLAILEYNNTAKADLPAPSVLLMGRSLGTAIPVLDKLRKPKFELNGNFTLSIQNTRENGCVWQ